MTTSTWGKWLGGLIAFIVLGLATAWVAGFLFLVFSKMSPFGQVDMTTWLGYWQYYQGDAEVVKRLNVSAIVAAVICYGIPIIAVIAILRNNESLHGEARFANQAEIAKAGLFNNSGIIIGKWKNKFLHFPGAQFVLLAAPTRSGKGVGVVIPNLLNFQDSVVVLDVKLENFLITSKFRQKNGQKVFLFNPFAKDGKTHRYNPLGYISDNPRERVAEILSIGYALFPGAGKDAFFDDAARNLFLGLTLYLCETPKLPRTMGELLRQSSGKGQPIKDYITGLINNRNYKKEDSTSENGQKTETLSPITQWDGTGLPPLSMECVDALSRFTSTSDNTLSSILASFNTPLTVWVSPLVDAATSENDFDLREVRKKRMTIYLGIPANKLAEAELILNLFFSQLINLNTDELLYSTPELKYPCLLLMDEFTAPGRIGVIDKSNSYMAGYGMRLMTIIQSPGQLEAEPKKGYGKESARTLITNHALQILYTPREQKDANEYSEMLGYYTYKARSVNLQERSKGSESDQRRALMLPQELKEMSQKKQLIIMENTKTIQCEKIAYYAEPVFMNRLKSVSSSLSKIGKRLPTKDELETAWGSGEMAITVPFLDLDIHEAIVQNRVREMTVEDVKGGIDLDKLALNTNKPVSNELGVEEKSIDDYVNDFFDMFDDVETEANDSISEDMNNDDFSSSNDNEVNEGESLDSEADEFESIMDENFDYEEITDDFVDEDVNTGLDLSVLDK